MQVISVLCSSLLFQLKKNISLVQRPYTKLHQCGRDNSHQRHKQQIYDAQLSEKWRRDVCSCCESDRMESFAGENRNVRCRFTEHWQLPILWGRCALHRSYYQCRCIDTDTDTDTDNHRHTEFTEHRAPQCVSAQYNTDTDTYFDWKEFVNII